MLVVFYAKRHTYYWPRSTAGPFRARDARALANASGRGTILLRALVSLEFRVNPEAGDAIACGAFDTFLRRPTCDCLGTTAAFEIGPPNFVPILGLKTPDAPQSRAAVEDG